MAGKCKTQKCRDRQARKAAARGGRSWTSRSAPAQQRSGGGLVCLVERDGDNPGNKIVSVIKCFASEQAARAYEFYSDFDIDYVKVRDQREADQLNAKARRAYMRSEEEA